MSVTYEDFVQLMNGEAKEIPCDSGSTEEMQLNAPPWFDLKKFTRGRKFILENLSAQLITSLNGLMCVLAVPNTLKILIHTNKSLTTLSAYRRYLSTILHMYTWIQNDLHPGTESWKSLLIVRKRHLRVSQKSQTRGDGMISQRDLVITLFGFFGYSLLKPEKVGLRVDNEEDMMAYLHFWRTIGFMVGIQDKFNFCDGTVSEAKKKLQYVCEDICLPHLTNPPEYFYHMLKAMLDGMFYVTILIQTKPALYFVHRLNDVPGFDHKPHRLKKPQENNNIEMYHSTNSSRDSVNSSNANGHSSDQHFKICEEESVTLDGEKLFNSMTNFEIAFVFGMVNAFEKMLYTRIGRWFLNLNFCIIFFLLKYIPYIAFFKFGWKKSFVDIFVDDVSIPVKMKTNREVLDELYMKKV